MEGVRFSEDICRDLACAVVWLDHWQTLAGAAIALPLAFWAIMVPIVQERGRLKRRAFALRASLPIRLREIAAFATLAMTSIAACRSREGTDKISIATFRPPVLPDTLIDGLERTMEALDSHRVNRRLASIIEQLQVLQSRMGEFSEETWDGNWLDSCLVQAATVYAQAEALFEYGRRRSNKTSRVLAWGDVCKALHLAKIFDVTHPEVYQMIKRYRAAGLDPEKDPRPMKRRNAWKLWGRRRVA